ncbi:hypothetical protein SAMN05216390_1415 [Lachnospiraceae bacterium KH1T2]|nr:hypothetical protein SAMN05216390_1415 [Lachnospiraceae bacterium KH1T2]
MEMNNNTWSKTYGKLVDILKELGYQEDFGRLIAKNLGSEKTMVRMIAYLENVRPKRAEDMVDEMLAIMEDRKRWIDKKESEI